ncbi:hypothetical protein NQZ68_038726 [Dissostichus eleginoides]|nr:hypothetical protein NQZ68_038726 [Dissostichus eleginoides]
MVINPMCCCVDEVSGNIRLPVLRSWTQVRSPDPDHLTQGVSSLSLLMSEMRQAFQKDTPLYARCPVQAPPPAADGNRPRPISPQRTLLFITPPHLSAQKGSQWEQSRKSYAEELQGIDFSCPAPSDPLSRGLEALSLDPQQVDSPVWTGQSGANIHTSGSVDLLPAAVDHIQMAAGLPPDQKITFLSLLKEGRGFRPADVFEAVQLSPDYPSALRFLTHCCPLCQEQVTFSKIISMTHCSCFLCESCFKAFFSSAIKEKSIDQLTCPQCGRPEVRGQGGGMEYFNLLDTQIRHFLPPQTHELFQRKLRDRALQEMPNFIWCSHCSFGILHEADRLKMDCPSCKKSTCCQCRSPWSPEHQGVSCQQFRVRQHQNQPDLQNQNPPLLECPGCSSVFSVSRGGCLHFTCSQCQHQFCGGCRQTFSPGAACRFSTSCGGRGLHAHHPRDCLYHLRDWRVSRLLLLLQCYRVSPSGCDSAPLRSPDSHTGVCPVMEVREEREEACGRAAPPQYRGYCESHFKECLVQLINRCRGDPAVLFSVAEMGAELQRWGVAVPTRRAEEAEPEYTERLRTTLTNSVPLRKHL